MKKDRDSISLPFSDAAGVALLAVDVQKRYADPEWRQGGNRMTDEVAGRIARVAPHFRAAGVPVFAVYYDYDRNPDPRLARFHKFAPQPGDISVAKNDNSAFTGSNIRDLLNARGCSTLLVCGFNLSACVFATTRDALKEGFRVVVLRDLTANDNHNREHPLTTLNSLRAQGAAIVNSYPVLRALHAPRR